MVFVDSSIYTHTHLAAVGNVAIDVGFFPVEDIRSKTSEDTIKLGNYILSKQCFVVNLCEHVLKAQRKLYCNHIFFLNFIMTLVYRCLYLQKQNILFIRLIIIKNYHNLHHQRQSFY